MSFLPTFQHAKRFGSTVGILWVSNCQFQVAPFLPVCSFPLSAPFWIACYSMEHSHHHPLGSRPLPLMHRKLQNLTHRCCQTPGVISGNSFGIWVTASQAPGFQRPLPPFLFNIAHSCGKILTLCLPRVPENPNFNFSYKPRQALIPATFKLSQLLSTICSGSFFNSLSPCHELGSQAPSIGSPFLLFSSDYTLNKSFIFQVLHFFDLDIIMLVPISWSPQVITKLNWDNICQLLRRLPSTQVFNKCLLLLQLNCLMLLLFKKIT